MYYFFLNSDYDVGHVAETTDRCVAHSVISCTSAAAFVIFFFLSLFSVKKKYILYLIRLSASYVGRPSHFFFFRFFFFGFGYFRSLFLPFEPVISVYIILALSPPIMYAA